MTTASYNRASLRRLMRVGLAGTALLAAVTGASADDGGLGGFLASIFGGHPQQAAPAPQPAQIYIPASTRVRRPHVRPLVVRLHAKPRTIVAQAPAKPGKVSLFEDPTLRRGDAVMTSRGVRIFAGSNSWPYRAEDFVALKDAKSLDRDATKVLAQLDRLPRG